MAVFIHIVEGGRGEGEGKGGLVLEGCGGGRRDTNDTTCHSTEVGMQSARVGMGGGLTGKLIDNRKKGTGLKKVFRGFIITWLGISGWLG